MSKIFVYLSGVLALALLGGFVFFAISAPHIEQQDIIIDVSDERFG